MALKKRTIRKITRKTVTRTVRRTIVRVAKPVRVEPVRPLTRGEPVRELKTYTTDGRVITGSGTPSAGLYYIGPWLRARDWESTAVPELREHATNLAQTLFDNVRAAATA